MDAIIFDINGTLLDMQSLDPQFGRSFRSADYREKWFAQLQVLWMTTIACDTYQAFQSLGKAALQMLAAKNRIDLSTTEQKAILEHMSQLPAFPDVSPALAAMRAAGHRLVALTNGELKSARSQLKFAGLLEQFDDVFSADQVERYKPAPEPYLYAAKQLGVKPKKLLMVAAHAWDIAGAYQANLQTAFVARSGQVLNPLSNKPDYIVQDLSALARKLG